MVDGFTRQETLFLTELKSGKLSYYDSIRLVSPSKYGNPSRPKVFYSAEQLLQLKIIQRLRGRLSLDVTKEIIAFAKKRNYDRKLFECKIIAINSTIYFIEDWEEFGKIILNLSQSGKISIDTVGEIGDVVFGINIKAKNGIIPDYEKRIKNTVLGENNEN